MMSVMTQIEAMTDLITQRNEEPDDEMERTMSNLITVIQKMTTMSMKKVLMVRSQLIMQKRRKKKRGSKHLEKQ